MDATRVEKAIYEFGKVVDFYRGTEIQSAPAVNPPDPF
jgi:hypothetical protein